MNEIKNKFENNENFNDSTARYQLDHHCSLKRIYKIDNFFKDFEAKFIRIMKNVRSRPKLKHCGKFTPSKGNVLAVFKRNIVEIGDWVQVCIEKNQLQAKLHANPQYIMYFRINNHRT